MVVVCRITLVRDEASPYLGLLVVVLGEKLSFLSAILCRLEFFDEFLYLIKVVFCLLLA